MKNRPICVAALLVAATLGSAPVQGADDLKEFYGSRSLTMIVGAGAGGNYGLAARLLSRHFGRYIPGQPHIIVKNMPGYGSIKAANYINKVAPQDGSVIGNVLNTLPLSQVLGRIKGDLDVAKLQWIGNPVRETFILVTIAKAPATTYDGLLKKEVLMGATAPTALSSLYPKVMNALLGTKMRIVSGYKSFKSIDIALAQAEVHGSAGAPWYGVDGAAGYSPLIRQGKLKVVMQFGFQKAADLPGVPLLKDLGKTADDARLLELFSSPAQFGKPTLVAPMVPAQHVAALRKAYMETMKDPAYIAETKKFGINVSPVSGEELGALTERLIATPATLVQRARQMLK